MRIEYDSIGKVYVPNDCYYGAHTQRALDNFDISGTLILDIPELLVSFAWIKKAAAITNHESANLSFEIAQAICDSCDEVIAGKLREEFCVDVLQGGAGTSTNMNFNEVIANRALEIMGHEKGLHQIVHPNDHVNCSQSTNDSYATAVRLTVYQLVESVEPELEKLIQEFRKKATEFSHIKKLARTQLQDAVPIFVGEEFEAYAETLEEDLEKLNELKNIFLEVNLGGTAVGNGVGADMEYQQMIIPCLSQISGLAVQAASNKIEATWDMGAFTLLSGMYKRLALKLSKICNDLRLLSSGPVGGLGEISLPIRQVGSSIMPGKVNPVIPEVVNQACFRVFGADTTITFAAESGQLQLNAMEPVILYSLHESSVLLRNSIQTLTDNCIKGITVNEDVCLKHLNDSTALAVNLVADKGYEFAAKLAKDSQQSGISFVKFISRYHPELLDIIRR